MYIKIQVSNLAESDQYPILEWKPIVIVPR